MAAAVLKEQRIAQAEHEAAERKRQAEARQAEEERRRSQPQPKPEPDYSRGRMIGGLPSTLEPEQTITITTRMPYQPTPLYRRRR